MRKFFLFFAAMLVALTASATPIEPGAGALSSAIAAADNGAVIELNAGNFTEAEDVSITKDITIKAANMASKPVLLPTGSLIISSGAVVKLIGIDINATNAGSSIISVTSTGANSLELDSCEIYNTGTNIAIQVGHSKHLDLLKISNCYFHDGNNSVLYTESSSSLHPCDKVEIINSTFANFTGFSNALIEIYSKGGAFAATVDQDVDVKIDHCTFYKYIKSADNTYGFIDCRKSKKTIVSNNIFVNPSPLAEGQYNAKATQLYAGTISNNLLYKVSSHRTDANTSISGDINQDPVFVEGPKGNLHIGDGSPALDAGTDDKTLGDPRWWPVVTYPETNFADNDGAGYFCMADDASLSGGNGKFTLVTDADPHYLKWSDVAKSQAGIATWKITATRACLVDVRLDLGDSIGSNKHIFEVQVFNEGGNEIDSVAEGPEFEGDGFTVCKKIIDLGTILIPEAGTYTFKLLNNRDFGKGAVKKVILKYHSDLPTVSAKGDWDSWANDLVFTLGKGGKTASVKKTFNKGDEFEFKMIINGEWRANGYWFKRDVTSASGITENGSNMKIIADYTGEYTLTWTLATNAFSIEFPELPKFYITGLLGEWVPDAIPSQGDSYTFENLPAGSYAFKVTADGTWGTAKGYSSLTAYTKGLFKGTGEGADNICFILDEAGDVTITYTGEVFTVAGAFGLPAVKLVGSLIGSWEGEDAVALVPAEDGLTATKTLNLAMNEDSGYAFKVIVNGPWLSLEGEGDNSYVLHRDWATAPNIYYDSNTSKAIWLSIDVAGDYKFTWTYQTNTLAIIFPAKTPTAIDNTVDSKKAVKMIENGQIVILKNGVRYNVLGAQIK